MKRAPERRYTMRARAEGVADTRERIARAALALALERAYEDITLTEIAAAAGVSHQTVLNHFGSKDGAIVAAAAVLRRETTAARAEARPGDVPGVLAVLVAEYERFGDANARWAAASERLGGLGSLLDEARAGHQEWLQVVFADSLPTTLAARTRVVNALHAATDVYTWKLLRRDLRLGRAETERTMAELVLGILDRSRRGRTSEDGGPR